MAAMPDPLLCPHAVQAWARLVRAEGAVLAKVERDLKNAGFPPLAWYDVLLELDRSENGLRPFELEERMLLKQYNLSRLVDRMEADGLVRRQRCPTDARGFHLCIEPAGRDLRERMWPVYAESVKQHFATRLGDGEACELARLLGKLIEG
jgi:DNA-binding MarR family transcriptional regulator